MPDICILTRKYESRGDIAAIGYDHSGGWSYGAFQLASRMGSVANFLRFLEKYDSFLFNYLTFAGGNIGAVNGSVKFKAAWKQLSAVHGYIFAKAQEEFLLEQYYAPAVRALQKIGFDIEVRSTALSNVALSLSVMAGPGTAIPGAKGACGCIADALETLGGVQATIPLPDSTIIRQIYASKVLRLDSGKEYASSTDEVRAAVRHRLLLELADALEMAEAETPGTPALESA